MTGPTEQTMDEIHDCVSSAPSASPKKKSTIGGGRWMLKIRVI
jgi:hypothetical protein